MFICEYNEVIFVRMIPYEYHYHSKILSVLFPACLDQSRPLPRGETTATPTARIVRHLAGSGASTNPKVIGISRRGTQSRQNVGEIDHRLRVGNLPDEKWDDSEPTVTFSQCRGAVGERAQNVGALDKDKSARLLAQQLRQVVATSCDFLGYRGQGNFSRAIFFSRSSQNSMCSFLSNEPSNSAAFGPA
jgi:hypothetical protein